jgi:hypothetical protein
MQEVQRRRADKRKLIKETVRLGFDDVIDAFHVGGQRPDSAPILIVERKGYNGIRITDEFSELLSGFQADNLPARLRRDGVWLVETA